MDKEYGAGARRDGAFERLKINEPAVCIFERVRDKANVLKTGKEFEERIAWFRKEDFIAGITEQAEDMRVGFAGACGEKKGFRIDNGLVVVDVVAGDFTASCNGTFRLGVVLQCVGILETREDGFGIVVEAALGGVRCGQIKEWDAGGAEFVEGDGEAIARE